MPDPTSRSRRAHSRLGRSRLLALVASVALGAGLVAFGAAAPATAAGSGVLDLTVKAVDPTNGNSPVTDAQNGAGPAGYTPNNTITYLVQYSCSTANCDNAKVTFTPPPPPYGLLPAGQSLLKYSAWVAPAGVPGATIGGNDTTGKVISLGNLASGSSGVFTVSYVYDASPQHEVANGAFYPDGYQIQMGATMSSDTATADKTADAPGVTWHIGVPTGPVAALGGAGTYQVDQPITLGVAVSTGNGIAGYNNCQTATSSLTATGNYTITYHVPANAVIDSATNPSNDAMVIDNTNHTVTWTKGSVGNQVYGARAGFGSPKLGGTCVGAGTNNGASDDSKAYFGTRNVVIHFPASNFPGCDFSQPFQTSLDVVANYVDAAKTQGTLTGQKLNGTIGCHAAYGGLNTSKDVVGGSTTTAGDGALAGGVYAILVPVPGAADRVRDWRVRVGNRGNVASVATVTESDLSPNAHVKVTQIYPDLPTDAPDDWGVKVDWTLNDGTTGTDTGISPTNKLVAPAGKWYTAATVVTDPIPPESVLPSDNVVNFTNIHYTFHVDDTANIGDQIVNNADVSMDYPGYGAGGDPIQDLSGNPLPTLPLTQTVSRTIKLMQPSPALTAGITTPTIAPGGQLNAVTPSTPVTWTTKATTSNVWPGTTIQPQVVFMAPESWKIVPGSAAMDGNAPPGVNLQYSTLVYNGVTRDIVIATWPSSVTPSSAANTSYGNLSVQAVPLPTAPAGVAVGAAAIAGDATGHWSRAAGAVMTTPNDFLANDNGYTDANDLDGDGNTTESFAATFGALAVKVATLPGLGVTKEICSPDITKTDGCDWVANGPTTPVTVDEGHDIEYRLTMTNTGNQDLTNAVATDSLPHTGDGRGSQFDQTLTGTSNTDPGLALDYSSVYNPGAWGAAATGAKSVKFTAATLPIGASYSTIFTTKAPAGTADGSLGCNTLSLDSDQTLGTSTGAVCAKLHVTAPPADPSLKLTKTAALTTDTNGNGKADKGDVITYSFKVENTGNVDATDVAIDDAMVATTSPAAADVAAGANKTFTATYTVKQSDVDAGGNIHNSATASGTWDDAGTPTTVTSNTSTADVTVAAATTGLTLDKTASITTDANGDGKADKGDVITYSFKATNSGNVTLTNVSIDDAKAGLSAISPASVATLAPGDDTTFTATYTVKQSDVDAGVDIDNTATADAKGPGNVDVVSPSSEAKTPVAVADPELDLLKSASITTDANGDGKADKGDVITYSFKATNSGNVTLTDVSIDDAMTGLSAISPASVATLAPGDDTTFTATYTVTQADVDAGKDIANAATASAEDPSGTPLTSPESDTTTTIAPADPELDVDKTADLTTDNGTAGKADKGDVITYTITATNKGNVTLTDVSIADAMTGLSAISPASVATLAPGDDATFTATYTVTQDDIDAGVDVVNAATGSATDPAGGAVSSAPASARTPVIAADPDVSVTKSADLTTDRFVAGKADAGDVITYTFTAHNGGLATAHDVSITDALPGLSAISPASVADLAPGADAIFTATYVVTRADAVAGGIDNTASVSSRGPTRGGVVPAPVVASSNAVTVAAAPLGTPRITTRTTSKVTAKTTRSGGLRVVKLTDKVTISGLRTGSTSTGTATLYGPTATRTASACVTGKAVRTVKFAPRNGTFSTPSVSVNEPGYYTWVVSTTADSLNDAATHACGLAAETTLVHRADYGKIHIETGFDGVAPSGFFARMAFRPSVSIKAIGMRAALDTVGLRRGSMVIPADVARAGWLSRSAAPGETIGSSVIAGHVSNEHDRPGAFGKLVKARIGQIVTVRTADGVHRYRITRIHRQGRGKGFTGAITSTTGAPKLILVTCTDEVHYANGHFHYRKNLVVTAVPIG